MKLGPTWSKGLLIQCLRPAIILEFYFKYCSMSFLNMYEFLTDFFRLNHSYNINDETISDTTVLAPHVLSAISVVRFHPPPSPFFSYAESSFEDLSLFDSDPSELLKSELENDLRQHLDFLSFFFLETDHYSGHP